MPRHFLHLAMLAICSIIGLHATAQFVVNGSASATGGDCYQLTPNILSASGSIWKADLIDLTEPFRVDADIYLGTSDPGADGLAFVLQPISTAVGGVGGGVGYAGISPSAVVEFDTYTNGVNGDPFCDHVALVLDGDPSHLAPTSITAPVNISATACNVEDGTFHGLSIRWDPAVNELEVYVDCALRISTTIDLISLAFGGDPNVYFGFTAGTGGLSNEHRVCFRFLTLEEPTDSVTVCAGESVVLDGPTGFAGYSWTPTAGLDDPTIAMPTATPSSATTYVVQFLDDCGNPLTDTIFVGVTPPPAFDVASDTVLCNGTSLTLNAPAGISSIVWPDGSSGPTFSLDTSGIYIVQATVGACLTADTFQVFALSPMVDPGADASVCNGDSVQVVLPTQPGISYTWSNGSTSNATWFSSAGTYTLTAEEGPCSVSVDWTLAVNPLPIVVFPKDSLPWCPGEDLILAPASDASSFLWDNGLSSAAIQVDQPGTYSVTGTLGVCTADDAILVFEDPACFCRPIIPNAFTPNGDGLNDVWRLLNVGDCPDTDRYMLLLFNRWGELMWESQDIQAGWDGTWRGRPAETGAYLYKIRLRLPDEGEVLWQGNVTLLR